MFLGYSEIECLSLEDCNFLNEITRFGRISLHAGRHCLVLLLPRDPPYTHGPTCLLLNALAVLDNI